MHLSRFRSPLFYRVAARFALLAMLVPLLAGFIPMPMAGAAQGAIHICGADRPGNSAPEKAPGHKTPSCPICQSLHIIGAGFVPPDVPAVDNLSLAVALSADRAQDFLVSKTAYHPGNPRAPPAFA